MKKLQGFTLIELLAVMGMFGVIGIVIVSILFTSLRASRKTDVLVMLKQNGDTALSQMTNRIRYAKSLDVPLTCFPSVTQSSITITSLFDGGQTTFSCPGGGMTTPITSNSAVLMDTNSVSVTACSFTCSQATVSDAPTVTVKFTLSPKTTTGFVDSTGVMPFQTAILMRNLNQ